MVATIELTRGLAAMVDNEAATYYFGAFAALNRIKDDY